MPDKFTHKRVTGFHQNAKKPHKLKVKPPLHNENLGARSHPRHPAYPFTTAGEFLARVNFVTTMREQSPSLTQFDLLDYRSKNISDQTLFTPQRMRILLCVA